MAGTITALEPQKRSRDRVNVYLDGDFAFGLADFVATNLKVGMRLSDEEIAELKAADGLEHAHSRALDYLSYRPRSEAELRDYLTDKGFAEDVVEEVLARLKRVDLVDDASFARYWCDNRARTRPRGKRMLAYELRQKGISSDIIEQALDDYDEKRAVQRVAREQARRLMHLSPDEFQRRLYGRLARRGFPYDLIRETLAADDFPQPDAEQSEED
ncbi:MAG: RecX family transcriptional regulator [Anaerolineae bacterium]